jgi:O-acetyl-ADP-ribose deacetylase (regulator of RNase III)
VPVLPKGGSIFDTDCEHIVNTINLFGAMGKGLALEFRFRVPEMYYEYKEKCQNKELEIGRYWIYDKQNRLGKKILNFPTKNHYSHPSKIEYVMKGLEYFVENYEADGIKSVAFPLLGARNGKLDFRDVFEVLREYLDPLPIKIEVYINHSKCDEFTQSVKKLIENAPDGLMRSVLDCNEEVEADLRRYAKTIKSLPELLDYPEFTIDRVQKLYDYGYECYPDKILI